MTAVANFHRETETGATWFQGLILGFANMLGTQHSIKEHDHGITPGTARFLQERVSSTLDFLETHTQVFRRVSEMGASLVVAARECEKRPGAFIDPDLQALDAIKAACEVLDREIGRIRVARSSVFADEHLGQFDRERLAGSFYDCQQAAMQALATCKSVMAAVEFHDEACIAEEERNASLEELTQLQHGEDGVALLEALRVAEQTNVFSFAKARKDVLGHR